MVGRKKSTSRNLDEIIVLFEENGKHITRNYVVNYKSVFFSDKELSVAVPGKNLRPVVDSGVTGPATDEVTGPVTE